MPNFIKRIEKFQDNKLESGETVECALFLQPRGSFTQASSHAALGLLGGLLGHFLSKSGKEENERQATALTKKLPNSAMIIGVTNKKRVLVYKQKVLGASIESYVTEYAKGDIVDITIKSHFLMTDVTLHFRDTGAITLEATMFQKLKEFAALVLNKQVQ